MGLFFHLKVTGQPIRSGGAFLQCQNAPSQVTTGIKDVNEEALFESPFHPTSLGIYRISETCQSGRKRQTVERSLPLLDSCSKRTFPTSRQLFLGRESCAILLLSMSGLPLLLKNKNGLSESQMAILCKNKTVISIGGHGIRFHSTADTVQEPNKNAFNMSLWEFSGSYPFS